MKINKAKSITAQQQDEIEKYAIFLKYNIIFLIIYL